MKLKYTITLLSLATPLVTVAETDCLQDNNETLYEIISCLNNEIRQLKSELAKKEKTFRAKFFRDKLKNGGFGPEMVLIPAGYFRMGDIQGGGSSDEQPVHSVYVNKFAMGKFEVTVGEYMGFVKATNSNHPEWLEEDSSYNINTGSDDYYKKFGSALTNENHPIIGVSWYNTVAYTEWLSNQTGKEYRLPTEAEWEYAARAGTETKYWWGNDIDKSKANYNRNLGKTYPVGNYKPNPFGLYDTVGNLWEWTCSEYENKYNGKENKCINKNNIKNLVLRGGSWYGKPRYVRTADRSKNTPGNRFDGLGFRVVMAAAWTK